MESLQDEKLLPSFQQLAQRPQRMLVSSSRPIRALMIAFVLLLIYFFQPFTGGKHAGNTDSANSWVHWPGASNASTDPLPVDADEAAIQSIEGGPRIRQATMIYDSDKYNVVYERSVATHMNHGKSYDIPTHILRHDVVDAGFFNKPAFILGLVIQEMAKPYGQRADWIVWFDADTVILNPSIPWSLFLPPADFEHVHLLASRDQNGFNAGMQLVRVHEWTVKMFSEVTSLRQLRPEIQYQFEDQGATKWVIERPGYEEHVLYQPHDWWNAFGLSGEPYKTDRFLLHFAGVDCCGQPEKKTTIMGRWLDIVENHPEKYETPLENTTYPAQVEDYWKRLKNARAIQARANKLIEDLPMLNPDPLKKAQQELTLLVMRNADDGGKVNAGIKKVEGIITAAEGAPAAAAVKHLKDHKPAAPQKSKDGKKENKPAQKQEQKKEENKAKGP